MSVLGAVIKKDLLVTARNPQQVAGVFFFAALAAILASFALRQIGSGEEHYRQLIPGVFWIIVSFASVLSLQHSYSAERENQALSRLVLTAIDPLYIYLSKVLINLLIISSVQVIVLSLLALLFNVSLVEHTAHLSLIAFLGACGIAGLGTLLAGMASAVAARELLLPILLFPLLLPHLAGVVFLMQDVIMNSGAGISELEMGLFWRNLVIGYDLIILTLGSVLFEFAVRE